MARAAGFGSHSKLLANEKAELSPKHLFPMHLLFLTLLIFSILVFLLSGVAASLLLTPSPLNQASAKPTGLAVFTKSLKTPLLAGMNEGSSESCCVFEGVGCINNYYSKDDCSASGGLHFDYSCNVVERLCKAGCCVEAEQCRITQKTACSGDFYDEITDSSVCVETFCPEIEAGAVVDSDKDGVADEFDNCPDTVPGVLVDRYGCEVKLLTPAVPAGAPAALQSRAGEASAQAAEEETSEESCLALTSEPECESAGCVWSITDYGNHCCPRGKYWSAAKNKCWNDCASVNGNCISIKEFNSNPGAYARKNAVCPATAELSTHQQLCISCKPGFVWDMQSNTCVEVPPGAAECSDRVDNDGDGLIDDNDPGCYGRDDPSERNPNIECDDGLDNDLDMLIDFPDDIGCANPEDDSENELENCSDEFPVPEMFEISSGPGYASLRWYGHSGYFTEIFRATKSGGPYTPLETDPMVFDNTCEVCEYFDRDVIPGKTYYYILRTGRGARNNRVYSCKSTEELSANPKCSAGRFLICNPYDITDCACCDNKLDVVVNGECVPYPCDLGSPITKFADSLAVCNIPEKTFYYTSPNIRESRRTYILIPKYAAVTLARVYITGEPYTGSKKAEAKQPGG